MSYFYEQIIDIIKKVKSPHHATEEIIQMLENEGILDPEEDDDEDFEEDEEYGITENPFDPDRD